MSFTKIVTALKGTSRKGKGLKDLLFLIPVFKTYPNKFVIMLTNDRSLLSANSHKPANLVKLAFMIC